MSTGMGRVAVVQHGVVQRRIAFDHEEAVTNEKCERLTRELRITFGNAFGRFPRFETGNTYLGVFSEMEYSSKSSRHKWTIW
jgi:hypothetical protein